MASLKSLKSLQKKYIQVLTLKHGAHAEKMWSSQKQELDKTKLKLRLAQSLKLYLFNRSLTRPMRASAELTAVHAMRPTTFATQLLTDQEPSPLKAQSLLMKKSTGTRMEVAERHPKDLPSELQIALLPMEMLQVKNPVNVLRYLYAHQL